MLKNDGQESTVRKVKALLNSGRNFVLLKNDGQESTVRKVKALLNSGRIFVFLKNDGQESTVCKRQRSSMALLNNGRNFVLSKNDGQESTVRKDKDHPWPYLTMEEILFSRRMMARKVLYIKTKIIHGLIEQWKKFCSLEK